MTTEQQQSDREFERQALYDQYVAYSKAAARTLWVLVAIAFYLSYAISDLRSEYRSTVVERSVLARIAKAEAKLDYYDPGNRPLCPAPDGSIAEVEWGFSRRYTLPVLGIDVSGFVLVKLGPLVVFLLSILYWKHLRECVTVGVRLKEHPVIMPSGKHPPYVWLYNLQFLGPASTTLWQTAFELLPVLLLTAVVYTGSTIFGDRYQVACLAASCFSYTSALQSAMLATSRDQLREIRFGLPVLTVLLIIMYVRVGWAWDGSSAFNILDTSSKVAFILTYLALIGIPLISSGYRILRSLQQTPLMLVFLPLAVIAPPRLRRAARQRLRSWSFGNILGDGYIGYFRRRYHELKDLDRVGKPPPDSLLPNSR